MEHNPSSAATPSSIMNCIGETSSKHQEFLKKLRHYQRTADLTTVVTRQGTNLLHECIIQKRVDFLQHLAHVGVFLTLYDQPVGGENRDGSLVGCHPTELAIKVGDKAVRDELERILIICMAIKNDELRQACLAGNEERVRWLLKHNKCPIRTYSEWPTLYCAVASGNPEVTKMILAARMSPENQCYDQELGYIVNHSAVELLDILCTHRTINVKEVRLDKHTLMDIAVINGDKAMFKALRNAGAIPTTATLPLAALNGHTEFIDFILSDYPSEFHINQGDARHKRPLHFAVEKNRIDTVKLLLSRGADMTLLDKRGRSVIHTAADCGVSAILELLITHASRKGVLTALLNLKDKYLGSELCFLVRGTDQSQAAWHYVRADRAQLCIFRTKTRGGAVDVAQHGQVLRSGWGRNPQPEVVQEIEGIFDMVNINPEAAPDMTPLHCAIVKNNTKCAILLMNHGADIAAVDKFRLTPLHLACTEGNRTVICELLRRGANRQVIDLNNRTPAILQTINEHPNIMAQMGVNSQLIKEVEHFLEAVILPVQKELSTEKLRTKGERELKYYIRDTLRELEGQVNGFLYDKCGVAAVTSPSNS